MSKKFIERIGWVGFILIIGAYLLLTLNQIGSSSLIYHALNFAGACAMVLNAFYNRATPLMWLNIVWAGIVIWGMGAFFL